MGEIVLGYWVPSAGNLPCNSWQIARPFWWWPTSNLSPADAGPGFIVVSMTQSYLFAGKRGAGTN